MAYAVKGIPLSIPPLSATPTSLKGATFSTADQNTLYSRKGICIQLPAVIPPASTGTAPNPGDFVQGPFTTKGTRYWLQRETGNWFVWFSTDDNPDDPDARFPLAQYLADPVHAEEAPGILRKARNFGYEG